MVDLYRLPSSVNPFHVFSIKQIENQIKDYSISQLEALWIYTNYRNKIRMALKRCPNALFTTCACRGI